MFISGIWSVLDPVMATETNLIQQSNELITVKVIKSSPLPMRLTKLIKDEEWISGSELRTDNSSSDDELSPIRDSTCSNNHLKVKKLKTRRKKRIATLSSKLEESKNNLISHQIHPDSESTERMVTNLHEKLDLVNVSDDDGDIVWRPKRGSISLIGLESEFSKIK